MSRRHSIKPLRPLYLTLAMSMVAACSSTPQTPATSTDAAPARAVPQGDDSASATVSSAAPIDLPPRAVADFERAVNLLRAGNTAEAELEFKQLAAGYPQFAGPHVNLGLLHRKAGRLEQAEEAFNTAVGRNAASALAWNELGVTLRLRGEFQDAAAAYERAIAADPDFAPAHRNLGVLLDLYLGDAARALAALERYKELSGEDKPVSGWIAELKQRIGK